MILLPVSRLHDSLLRRLEMSEKDDKYLKILSPFVLFTVIECVKKLRLFSTFQSLRPQVFLNMRKTVKQDKSAKHMEPAAKGGRSDISKRAIPPP